MINTKQVSDRRELCFDTLGDAVRDAEQLAAWEGTGALKQQGNWTPGMAIAHVAYWAERPFVGYPEEVNPPWLMRMAMRLMLRLILKKGMMAGVRIPGAAGGTLGQDDMPVGEAVERLRAAFEQIDNNCPPDPNPLFGPMTHDQWRQLNQRHAELHFSFFQGE